MISIHNLTRRFGDHVAVDAVDLEIPSDRIFGLIGPNGAGKSTLFRLICQIIRPDQGTVSVNDVTDEIGIKQQIGYLPEEHRLYEHMRTLAYLEYFCGLVGVPKARARQVLDRIELTYKEKSKISSLSKGMRQKLAFGRTLLNDPPVLVLDEPTYGLDPRTSSQMRGWIRDEARDKTIVLSSHNLHEAERICDRIAIIHRGRIAIQGTPRELIEELREEHVLEVRFAGAEAPVRRALGRLDMRRPPLFEVSLVRLYFDKRLNAYTLLQQVLEAMRAESESVVITGIAPREATLEDLFLKVTGEAFEEADEASGPQGNASEGERMTRGGDRALGTRTAFVEARESERRGGDTEVRSDE